MKDVTRKAEGPIVKRKIHKKTPNSETFIYVNRNTALFPLVKKIRKQLIQNNAGRVTLCGLGAAIAHTASLALKIQDMIGGDAVCALEVRTGTLDIVDEIVPEDADKDIVVQSRKNSKIEIDIVAKKKA